MGPKTADRYHSPLLETYLPNGNFEKTGQRFSVKTGQNTGQNVRALPWMPSEVPTGCREKGCNFIDL